MKCFIILSAFVAVALARPGHLLRTSHHVSHVVPLNYAAPHTYTKLVPAAPIGHDGRVVDTPEVAHAKAEHVAAHAHVKTALAHEAHNSADHVIYAAAPAHVVTTYHSHVYAAVPVATIAYHEAHGSHNDGPVAYAKLVPAAPIGHDGRVIDTPEVAHAKAAHFASHEQIKATLRTAPKVHLVSAYSSGAYEPHYTHQW